MPDRSRLPRIIGRRLEMTSGTEYGGTPIVVHRYQPVVVLGTEDGSFSAPAHAVEIGDDGRVLPKWKASDG